MRDRPGRVSAIFPFEGTSLTRVLLVLRTLPRHPGRGWRWLRSRLVREWRSPGTSLGRWIRGLRRTRQELSKNRHLKMSSDVPVPDAELRYFWDLAVCPLTFDIVWNLCHAEVVRRSRNLASIHVLIVPEWEKGIEYTGQYRAYDQIINSNKRTWRLHNVIIPCLLLMPGVQKITVCQSRADAESLWKVPSRFVFPPDYSVQSPTLLEQPSYPQEIQSSECFHIVKTPEGALGYIGDLLARQAGGRRTVTITLRQYDFAPDQNSNVANWISFIDGLDPAVYLPIIIPDTESSFSGLPADLDRHFVFEPAAWNVHLRSALYERAWLNMGVVTGPIFLAVHSPKARYVIFCDAKNPALSSKLELMGLSTAGNPAFCLDGQRWVWEQDTLENICRVFGEIEDSKS